MGSIEVQTPSISSDEDHLDTPQTQQTSGTVTETVTELNGSSHSSDITTTTSSKWDTNGLESEIILLAWLIVLLRTREDITAFWFEWAWTYQDDEDDGDEEVEAPAYRLQVAEIVTDLNANIPDTLARISNHVKKHTAAAIGSTTPSPSLLLSTASLARTCSEIPLEEVSYYDVHPFSLLSSTNDDISPSFTSTHNTGKENWTFFQNGTIPKSTSSPSRDTSRPCPTSSISCQVAAVPTPSL